MKHLFVAGLWSTVFFLAYACASKRDGAGDGTPFLADISGGGGEFKWHAVSIENRAAASSFIAQRLQAVADLTRPDIDPYKGLDSVPAICRKENLPSNQQGEEAGGGINAFVSLYSSAAHVLGFCANPSDVVKTQYLLLYCGRDQLFVIQYFYGAKEPWKKEPVARCRRPS